jgi:hypothetical protein
MVANLVKLMKYGKKYKQDTLTIRHSMDCLTRVAEVNNVRIDGCMINTK